MHSFLFRILFLLFVIPSVSKAQFVSAKLVINGLTCSLCSYGVQSELERLPFVENTSMDLNTNIATITFKANQKVNMRELIGAVYKAGFSVGQTEVNYIFDQLTISDQSVFSYEGERYTFLKPSKSLLNGPTTIKFIDKKFIGKKAFSFWGPIIKESVKVQTDPNIYHITL